jgi:hypothetical protein
MRRFAEEDDARIADAPEQRLEIGGFDRIEGFAGRRDGVRQHWLRCRRRPLPRRRCRAGRIRRPAFRANQRHEAHVGNVLGPEFLLRDPRDAHELLDMGVRSDRNDEPATDPELRLQRFRHFRTARRHDDRIVGRVFGPPDGAVGMEHVHVAIAETCECRRRLFRERAKALHRVDAARDPRQNRGRVSGAGTDFQDFFAAPEREGLGHQRDDVRLRDRLPFRDGQRRILVGELAHPLRQKRLARHFAHRVKHARRAHPAAGNVMLDHFLAQSRKVTAGARPVHGALGCGNATARCRRRHHRSRLYVTSPGLSGSILDWNPRLVASLRIS